MKGISHHTAAFYHCLFTFIAFGILIAVTGMGDFFYRITWLNWFFISLAALFQLTYSIFRQAALQYDTASKLTLYNYSQAVIQMMFDVFLFHYRFILIQYIGMAIVITINVAMILNSLGYLKCCNKTKKASRASSYSS